MSQRFTAIHYVRLSENNQTVVAANMRRFELEAGETVADALEREGILDTTTFLFVGWPMLQGEDEET